MCNIGTGQWEKVEFIWRHILPSFLRKKYEKTFEIGTVGMRKCRFQF